MISAVANGGTVYWPRLVARTEPQDPFSADQAVKFPAGRVHGELGISKNSLNAVRGAMLADVEDAEGTGTRAFVPGMRICAKTGTAQIQQGRKTIGHTTWIASFAPFDNARYVVVVMIEDGTSGGATSAPVAQQVYLALQKRCIKDEEFSQESRRKRDTRQRDHSDQHCKGEKWRTFGEAIKIGNLIASLLRDDYQDRKAQERHQQVSDKIESDRAHIETDDSDKQITRMRDAGVSKQPFQVCLWQGREIAINQSEQCDEDNQPLCLRQSQERE